MKYRNISQVLIELSFLPIRGYKPLANYQGALVDEVLAQVQGDASLDQAAAASVALDAVNPMTLDYNHRVVEAPKPTKRIADPGVVSRFAPFGAITSSGKPGTAPWGSQGSSSFWITKPAGFMPSVRRGYRTMSNTCQKPRAMGLDTTSFRSRNREGEFHRGQDHVQLIADTIFHQRERTPFLQAVRRAVPASARVRFPRCAEDVFRQWIGRCGFPPDPVTYRATR